MVSYSRGSANTGWSVTECCYCGNNHPYINSNVYAQSFSGPWNKLDVLKATGLLNRFTVLPLLLLCSVQLFAAVNESDNPAAQVEAPVSHDPQQTAQAQLAEQKATIDFYTEQVDRQLAEGDTYAPQLAESLFSLGRAFREQQQYQQALRHFRRALHIQKVSNGLSSAGQEPVLRELLATNLALGDWESAVQNMFALDRIYNQEYGPDDPARIPLMLELASWHLQSFVIRDKKISDHLIAASGYAHEGIRLVTLHYGENDLQKIDHLRNSALSNYYLAAYLGEQDVYVANSSFEFEKETNFDTVQRQMYANVYRNGKQDYKDMINLLYTNSDATLLQRAEAHAELGDWYLLFGKKNIAMRVYRDLLMEITDEQEREQVRKAVFEPLRVLPEEHVTSEHTVNPAGLRHVEIELSVDRYGRVDGATVISVEGEETITAQQNIRAAKILRRQRFRPLYENDDFMPRQAIRRTFKMEL